MGKVLNFQFGKNILCDLKVKVKLLYVNVSTKKYFHFSKKIFWLTTMIIVKWPKYSHNSSFQMTIWKKNFIRRRIKLHKYLFISEIGRQSEVLPERTVLSFETHEMTDGQWLKNKTRENEFYTVMEQIFSIKKITCLLLVYQENI